MKIRFDFVTNSSSCSFVVYGIKSQTFYEKVDLDKLKKIVESKTKYSKNELTEENIIDKFFENGLYEYFKFETSNDVYIEEYIGLSPEVLELDYPEVKLKDIRKLVANIFNNLFTIDVCESDVNFFNEIVSC